MNVKVWEGIKATFWEYHLTLNLMHALDLFETLLIFEITTEEQIKSTKNTTGRTSNTEFS